jgi:hypothetical protein
MVKKIPYKKWKRAYILYCGTTHFSGPYRTKKEAQRAMKYIKNKKQETCKLKMFKR